MMDKENDGEIILIMAALVIVVGAIVVLLARDLADDNANFHQNAATLIEQTGGVSAHSAGKLSSNSAVELWVVDYSEKPSEVFACVDGGETFVCQSYDVQP